VYAAVECKELGKREGEDTKGKAMNLCNNMRHLECKPWLSMLLCVDAITGLMELWPIVLEKRAIDQWQQ
jgi:hypothetical protein